MVPEGFRGSIPEITLKMSFQSIRMIPYFWCIELYSDIERKFSIRRSEIVRTSCCVTNEIRILLILDEDEQKITSDRDQETRNMTYLS
jgi:hypothetical protein